MRLLHYLLLLICLCILACKPKSNRWTLGPFREHFQGNLKSADDYVVFSGEATATDTFYTQIVFDTLTKDFLTNGAVICHVEDRSKPRSVFNEYGRFELVKALRGEYPTSHTNLKEYGRVIDYYAVARDSNKFSTYLGLTVTYDKNFNYADVKRYDSHGTMINHYVFVYGDGQDMLENAIYNSGGMLVEKRKYSYDNRHNETEYKICNDKDSLLNETVFHYDNFDSTGNWQKKQVYKNNKLYSTTFRSIVYF